MSKEGQMDVKKLMGALYSCVNVHKNWWQLSSLPLYVHHSAFMDPSCTDWNSEVLLQLPLCCCF
jgi:hypothetical protein